MQTDTLVAAAREGSRSAFLRLADEYQARVRAVVAGLIPGEGADLVARDGMVEAWRRLPELPAGTPFTPWLFNVVREVALASPAAIRHLASAEPAPDDPALPAPAPGVAGPGAAPTGSAPVVSSGDTGPPAAIPSGPSPTPTPEPAGPGVPPDASGPAGAPMSSRSAPVQRRISAELAELDDDVREAFLFASVAGMGYDEVALLTGRAPAAVANDVYRARVRLAAALTRGQETGNDSS
jgi:DNA-directed RNA polymerase specialized sigma24 family protein